MHKLRSFLLFLCFLMCTDVALSQVIRTYAIPDTLSIGDTFSYVITARYTNQNLNIIYPTREDFGDAFEVKDITRYNGVNVRDSVVYTLQFFALNDTLITEKRITFSTPQESGTLNTAPVPLYFRTTLSDGAADIRPFKPIFEFARSYWAIMLITLLLLVLGYLIWRNRHRFKPAPKPEPVKPVEVPPFVNPLRKLDNAISDLKLADTTSKENIKEFYFLVSVAIRRYFEETYDFPALESTTKEVIRILSDAAYDENLVKLTSSILRECDLVKFAKVIKSSADTKSILEELIKFREMVRNLDAKLYLKLKEKYEISHGLRQVGVSSKKPVLNSMVEESKTPADNKILGVN